MTFRSHFEAIDGKKVILWQPNQNPPFPPDKLAYALRLRWEDIEAKIDWFTKFDSFINSPDPSKANGLVIGLWFQGFAESRDSSRVVDALVSIKYQLPNLRTLFLGDLTFEEWEISWIEQSNVSPIFEAYPKLEYFGVRGGTRLEFGAIYHETLKSLVIQTGGMDKSIVRDIVNSKLPNLRHLEFWFGDPNYGATVEIADLMPIINGIVFPKLEYLGLRNGMFQDEIAIAIADSPILDRIHTLDLSKGTLGDEGATALLNSKKIMNLQKLDIHHHYCSEALTAQLQALPFTVDVSERLEPYISSYGHSRYVAVGE